MLYAIHNPETGEITQANKVFVSPEDLKPYEAMLIEFGQRFVKKADAPGLLPPERWYVDVKAGEFVARPAMDACAEASTIKAGADAVITGIPKGASLDVYATGYQVPVFSQGSLDADEIEFPMPAPCRYRVLIRRWPYQDCAIDIEAVA